MASLFGPVITETIMVRAWSRSCSLHGPWEAKREPVSPLKACAQWVNSILLISTPQTPPPHPKCLSGFQHYSLGTMLLFASEDTSDLKSQ